MLRPPSIWPTVCLSSATAVLGVAVGYLVPVHGHEWFGYLFLVIGLGGIVLAVVMYARDGKAAATEKRERLRFEIEKRALIEEADKILWQATNFYADDARDMERLRTRAVEPSVLAEAEAWYRKVLAFLASRPLADKAFRASVTVPLGAPDLDQFRLMLAEARDRLRAVSFDQPLPW